MDELTQLLSDLVAIDSVNPDLVPGGAGELQIAQFIAAWAARRGLEAIVQPVAPGRDNVVVIARGSGGGRAIMFNGHMDTVGTTTMRDPLVPRVDGGRIYGRGAFDMKCGIAASLLAAARASALKLRGDVIVACVVDEEVASIGSQAVVREIHRWRPDAVIVTEPTGMRLVIAHKGFVWLEIETRGRAAHGSLPGVGIDAIAKMGRVLVELERMDFRLRATQAFPLLGSGSLHASVIQGGQELSSYPERCALQVERRTIPGESPAAVLAQMQAMLDGLAAMDPDFHASVRSTLSREPFAVAPDSELAERLAGHAERALGAQPEFIGEPYWADAALFAEAGIPTIMFGPRGEGAHAAVEWVDLQSVGQCADIYLAMAGTYCG